MKLRAKFKEPLALQRHKRMFILKSKVNIFVNFLNSCVEIVDTFFGVKFLSHCESFQRELLVSTVSCGICWLLCSCFFRLLPLFIGTLHNFAFNLGR